MNNALSFLLFTALLASVEDAFNLDFDVMWIVIASSIFISTDKSLLFLLVGLGFVCLNPLEGVIGAGDIFFISLLYPFATDLLLWVYISSTVAIGVSIFFNVAVVPFLFPVIIGFSSQFYLLNICVC